MRKSVLVQRVFLIVLLALFLIIGLAALLYTNFARELFTRIKASELLPKARALGNLVLEYRTHAASSELIKPVLDYAVGDQALLGAYFVFTDQQGTVLCASNLISEADVQNVQTIISQVLAGNEVTVSGSMSVARVSMVGVGTPVYDGEQILGAILMFVPVYETLASMGSVNSALLSSLVLAMPFVVAMVYLMVGRVVRPLRQMRDVAINMANGNFNVRADDDQRGEIGQLAQSLNYLSRELSHNIRELTLSRNRLKQTIDGLREGIVSVNSLGNIAQTNPAVKRLFQTAQSNESDARLKVIPIPAVWTDFEQVIATGESISRDIAQGEMIIHMTITPLAGDDGENMGAVGLFSDISESARLERTRRDYVANVSHELRTPLTAMRALVEPMREGLVRSEEARIRYYDIILRETMRLSRLIDDLMELSRLQSGQLSLRLEPVNITLLIEDLAEKYRAAAEEHGQRFELLFEPNACPDAFTNADRVEQVLVILLDNAMKYTGADGLISLGCTWDEAKLTITVRDTGIGIAPNDLPYVFDRFYKADKAHSGSGSGLGLSIAREIMLKLGEDITAESQPGQGSAFRFTMRRATHATPPMPDAGEA